MYVFTALVVGSALLGQTAALPAPATASHAPKMSMDLFTNPFVTPITLEQAKEGLKNQSSSTDDISSIEAAPARCANPRTRVEWDNLSDTDRQGFVDSVKCLMTKPASGKFAPATTRYEDLARIHQMYTPDIHGNSKFIIWHRYYTWVFESLLRDECGFTGPLPWFDETKYAGKFDQSSIFSGEWLGAVNIGGDCVSDGQLHDIVLHIGPGGGNRAHCLQRNGNDDYTANSNSEMVDTCNSYTDYRDMASCHEGGVHAWGHNGIGGVMADVYASPSDVTFFLHHAFVDRVYWAWQQADPSRTTYVDGKDRNGRAISLSTTLTTGGIKPDAKIGDFVDTQGTTACYVYDY